MRMKKIILFFVACTVPVLLFLNTWQMYRYVDLKNEVINIEKEQKEWLEKNKKIIASIAVLRSPERIEMIAKDELGLEKINSRRVTKIIIE